MDTFRMHFPLSLARASILAGAVTGPLAVPALSHEFWIEPEAHQIEAGETVQAELFVGGMLSGEAYPYLSDQIVAAEVHAPDGVIAIEGMEGDLPALTVTPAEPGLHVILYHAAPAYIAYDEFDAFVSYLAYEGLDDVARLHKERGLPQGGFSEAYIRNARALLQVGPANPADVDHPTGMPLELVALQNPFVEGTVELEVQLLWQGAPVPNRQVSVFQRSAAEGTAGDVTRTLVSTDAAGQATIPLNQDGLYLLNAVQMKPAAGNDGFVWESHWATLTFAVEGS